MIKKDVKRVLNCPSKSFLQLCLELVNLKEREIKVVELTDLKGFTNEETAEFMNLSVDTISRCRRSAHEKMLKTWSKNDIILNYLKEG